MHLMHVTARVHAGANRAFRCRLHARNAHIPLRVCAYVQTPEHPSLHIRAEEIWTVRPCGSVPIPRKAPCRQGRGAAAAALPSGDMRRDGRSVASFDQVLDLLCMRSTRVPDLSGRADERSIPGALR
jgi:hypothetical protein